MAAIGAWAIKRSDALLRGLTEWCPGAGRRGPLPPLRR